MRLQASGCQEQDLCPLFIVVLQLGGGSSLSPSTCLVVGERAQDFISTELRPELIFVQV